MQAVVLDLKANPQNAVSGLGQTTAALGGLEKQVTRTSGATVSLSKSMSNLSQRDLKSIARTGLAQLSQEALSSATSMENLSGASRVAASSLSNLASAFAFVSGPVGITISALTVLVSLFLSLSNRSKESAESIKKHSEKLVEDRDNLKKLVDLQVIKAGLDNDGLKFLKDIQSSRQADIDARTRSVSIASKNLSVDAKIIAQAPQLLAQLEEERRAIGRAAQSRELTIAEKEKLNDIGDREIRVNQQLAAAHEDQAHSLMVLKGNTSLVSNEFQRLKTVSDAQAEAISIVAVENEKFFATFTTNLGLMENMKELQQELVDLEYDRARALLDGDDIQAESTQKRIDLISKLIDADQKELDARRQLESEQKAINDKILSDVKDVSNRMAAAFEAKDGKIVLSAKKAQSEIVKAIGQALVTEVQAKAVAAFATGDIPLGVALTAAAGVISGLTNAAAGAIAYEPPQSRAAGNGRGIGADAGAINQSPRQTQLNIFVQGHILGGEAALGNKIAQIISDQVQAGGAQLVATTVRTGQGVNSF